MPPANYEIEVYESEDFVFDLTLYDVNDVVIDLTGYTATMTARNEIGGTAIFSISTADSITLGGTAGTVAIDVPQATVTGWDFDVDRGAYELQITDGSGNDELILAGSLTMIPGVI